jgi:hypothetical protein
MSCYRYPASPLARWPLPSNGLGTDLQKTRHLTATHCCLTSQRTQRKHCSNVVGRVCVADVAQQWIYISQYNRFRLWSFSLFIFYHHPGNSYFLGPDAFYRRRFLNAMNPFSSMWKTKIRIRTVNSPSAVLNAFQIQNSVGLFCFRL